MTDSDQPPDSSPSPDGSESQGNHRLMVEPVFGTPVLMAPKRTARPILTTDSGATKACPFCEGSEASTPPETDAIRRDDSSANGPGWRVRSFPNKFAAWHHHEVLAEGPEHHELPSALPPGLWADVLELAGRRTKAMESRPGVAVAFWFRNVGRIAGASIRHNHSQLLGLPELPPRLAQAEARWSAGADGGALVDAAQRAEQDDRVIWSDGVVAVIAPEVPRLPHETWVLPHEHGKHPDPYGAEIRDHLATALHQLCLAIDLHFEGPAMNLWLNRAPGTGFPWHFQAQPRTGYLAGLELGGGMTINGIPPEQSAAALRSALG